MKHPEISLALIVKNDACEAALLRRCLRSVENLFDEIVVAVTLAPDAPIDPAFDFLDAVDGAEVYGIPWENDFSKARNFAFARASCDWVAWLDADDVLEGAARFRPAVEKALADGADWVWLAYDYDHDTQTGKCVNRFYRERVVRRGLFEWSGALHEYLRTAYKPVNVAVPHETCFVRHLPGEGSIAGKARRNLELALARYEAEKRSGAHDPRTVYDLGRSLMAVGRWLDAAEIFGSFLKTAGCPSDQFDACLKAAECFRKVKLYPKAREFDLRAVEKFPQYPDGYLGLAETFYGQERWDECRTLIERVARNLDRPVGVIPTDPLRYAARPLLFLQDCVFRTAAGEKDFSRALEIQKEALQYYPANGWLRECHDATQQILVRLQLEDAAQKIYRRLDGDEARRKSFLGALPGEFADHPYFVRERNRLLPEVVERRVVIFCGPTYEKWDGDSAGSGVGGSEEAVIHLSRQLSARGWRVDVFCSANAQKTDAHGVRWFFADQYDENVPCDVFVAWRRPDYVLAAPEGSVKILWLHDTQKQEDYSPRVLEAVDRVAVLSGWHRENVPWVPDEKIWITRNGIDPEQFRKVVDRNPLRCVYASSPDRGLDLVLEAWPEIHAAQPRAELHVYYGFTALYDAAAAGDPARARFKEHVLGRVEALKGKNVVWHGRVDHETLAREFSASGLWLYPTYFTEISCITAMKAQAAGMVPVCTSRAALAETVQYGEKVGEDIHACFARWKERVIHYLSDCREQDRVRASGMAAWALDRFAWERVGGEWDAMFNHLKGEKVCVQSC